MLYSSLMGRAVDLPLDGRAYERVLKKLVAISGKKKIGRKAGPVTYDVSGSFRGTQK